MWEKRWKTAGFTQLLSNWHRTCEVDRGALGPLAVIAQRTVLAQLGEIKTMIYQKKVGRLFALVVSALAISPLAMAGKKLEIDETKWISVGIGTRASYTSQEDAAPNGDDRSNEQSSAH